LEEFKRKKAAAQAAKKETPLTTPQITPIPTPIKAPEASTKETFAERQAGRTSQSAKKVDSRLSEVGQGQVTNPTGSLQRRKGPESGVGGIAIASRVAQGAEVPASVEDGLPIREDADAKPQENGNIRHGKPSSIQEDQAQLSKVDACLQSEREKHAAEIQRLEQLLSSTREESGAQHEATLRQHNEEVQLLHRQLRDIQSSYEQQAAATASDWDGMRARLEEQVAQPERDCCANCQSVSKFVRFIRCVKEHEKAN
jgi:hypothetical protein